MGTRLTVKAHPTRTLGIAGSKKRKSFLMVDKKHPPMGGGVWKHAAGIGGWFWLMGWGENGTGIILAVSCCL
ncbi:hypothetical protein [Enterocloster lavalensis]|uniref:hypothetical protein n=1 Tax=Enterocloster lavalensis TaxID=460384 RepID=UPI0034A474AA